MKRLINALFNTTAGLRYLAGNETAFRQELAAFALSVPMALLLTADPWRLIALWGSLILIMALEALNTGVEKICDRVSMEEEELIKIAKDCGSASVGLAIFLAGAIWLIAAVERI